MFFGRSVGLIGRLRGAGSGMPQRIAFSRRTPSSLAQHPPAPLREQLGRRQRLGLGEEHGRIDALALRDLDLLGGDAIAIAHRLSPETIACDSRGQGEARPACGSAERTDGADLLRAAYCLNTCPRC